MAWRWAVNHLEIAVLAAVAAAPGCYGAEIHKAIRAISPRGFDTWSCYPILHRLKLYGYISARTKLVPPGMASNIIEYRITRAGRDRLETLLKEINGWATTRSQSSTTKKRSAKVA